MRARARLVLWVACTWLALLAVLVLAVWLVLPDASDGDLALLSRIVDHLAVRLGAIGFLLAVPAVMLVAAVRRRHVVPARRLAADVRVMAMANGAHRAPLRGSRALRALARAVNAFADAHDALRGNVEERVRDANLRIEQERGRLSALLSELSQSVIVCSEEGRILLYNARAMHLLQEPLATGDDAEATFSKIGLGRSIFTVFDRNVVLHALDSIQDRVRQGEAAPVVSFVAAAGAGRLVRVDLAPAHDAASRSAGFVMILHDVTRGIDAAHRQEQSLHRFAEGARGSLSKVRVAARRAADSEDMVPGMRDEILASIEDEARRLGERFEAMMAEIARSLHHEWPLEAMRAVDLVTAASRRIERKLGLPTKVEEIDEAIWIEVDSHSLVQAFAYLAARLVEDYGIREVRFALGAEGASAQIEMIWTGAPLGIETTIAWQSDPLDAGGEVNPQTLEQIVSRHRGELRYLIRKLQHRECFQLSIPLSAPEQRRWRAPQPSGGRPEFYDFDLFHQPGQTTHLDNQHLSALNCTVFDTETTGLRPSEGDEIVSIGAVRIVNGRLLAQEVFEQLVDPGRPMSSESSRITGIETSMLRGQPSIAKVLPAFHRFCEETVLIAHNAAFDMRFLALKEASTGVLFPHPVLDTLLLSEVIHPDLESHRLEAIAERMGVRPIGRHTALGDAIMTAEVFLRMIPLLEQQGILTLAQAREASQKTRFAKIGY